MTLLSFHPANRTISHIKKTVKIEDIITYFSKLDGHHMKNIIQIGMTKIPNTKIRKNTTLRISKSSRSALRNHIFLYYLSLFCFYIFHKRNNKMPSNRECTNPFSATIESF